MKLFMAAGILGSILPDFDMFYFYFIDNRQHHHHRYWTHIPIFWLGLISIAGILLLIFKRRYLPILSIFAFNIFAHLIADSVVGDVWWLYPFIDEPYAFFTVTARYSPWWLNFIWHWSFLIELAIVFSAIYLLIKSIKQSKLSKQ